MQGVSSLRGQNGPASAGGGRIGPATGRHFILLAWIGILLLPAAYGAAKENLFSKDFRLFTGEAPGVDFLANERSEIATLAPAVAETRDRLRLILGEDLPSGAVFVCSSTEQRDAVYEPRALRMGYRWVVMSLDAAAGAREMMERIRARSGGDIPPERLERIRSRAAGMQSRTAERTLLEVGFAVLTTLSGDRPFRYSRLDDMNRSPLGDWLDIGIAYYGAHATSSQVAFLQRRISEMFSVEDILTMSRPFVVPATALGEGGQGFRMTARGPAGRPPGSQGSDQGPAPAPEAGNSLPKDVRDRTMFDAEAAALFGYLVERMGMEKVKALVTRNRAGEQPHLILREPEFLGANVDTLEVAWVEWIEAQAVGPRNRQAGERPRPETR